MFVRIAREQSGVEHEWVCVCVCQGEGAYTRHVITPGSWTNSPAVQLQSCTTAQRRADDEFWQGLQYLHIYRHKHFNEAPALTWNDNLIVDLRGNTGRGERDHSGTLICSREEQMCEKMARNWSVFYSYLETWVCCTCMHIKKQIGGDWWRTREQYLDKESMCVCEKD